MSGVKKIVMPVRGGYSVSLYSWMQSVTNQLNANTEAIALLLDEGLPQRVEQLEKEARTHMYWTPSEIEAAKRKADELIAFFNSKGDTAQGAKILPEHAHRMEQEGRWVCDICGEAPMSGVTREEFEQLRNDLHTRISQLHIKEHRRINANTRAIEVLHRHIHEAHDGLYGQYTSGPSCPEVPPTPDKPKDDDLRERIIKLEDALFGLGHPTEIDEILPEHQHRVEQETPDDTDANGHRWPGIVLYGTTECMNGCGAWISACRSGPDNKAHEPCPNAQTETPEADTLCENCKELQRALDAVIEERDAAYDEMDTRDMWEPPSR